MSRAPAMMRWVVVPALVVAWSAPCGAGEVVLKNGKRLHADLVGHLILSTGSDLLEIGSEQVVEVTPEAVRLSDGRTVRGTLVGGQLRARTEFGELAIPLDDLDVFRAAALPAPAPPAPPTPPPAVVASPPAAPPKDDPGSVTEGARQVGRGVEQTAKGIGRTVSEGAGRIHDGVKAFGLAIWDGMKEIGRTVERAFE
jgi:hypothetical protein